MSNKETFFFSHDYNARNDKRLVKVKHKHKMSGIGIYWCLVEQLYEEGGYLMLSDLKEISKELREPQSKVEQIVTGFELFQMDSEKFWSESVLKRLKRRKEKSVKASQSANKRWEKDANAEQQDCEGNALIREDSIGKDSIVKKEENAREELGEIGLKPEVEKTLNDLLTFYKFTETRNYRPQYVDLAAACTRLFLDGQLSRFNSQFSKYKKFLQTRPGREREGYQKFMGSDKHAYLDGAWNCKSWDLEGETSPTQIASYTSKIAEQIAKNKTL